MSKQEEQTPKVDEVEKVDDNEKVEQKNDEEIGKNNNWKRKESLFFYFQTLISMIQKWRQLQQKFNQLLSLGWKERRINLSFDNKHC